MRTKGFKCKEETKRKISEANKGCIAWNKGNGEYIKGNKNPNWKGGKNKTSMGYIYIYSPNHPYKTQDGYVMEHRLVMEKHLGRYLKKEERCHHFNGIKNDNRIKNLELFNSESEHQKNGYHILMKRQGRWSVKYKECIKCGTQSRRYMGLGLCSRCYQRQFKQKKMLSRN